MKSWLPETWPWFPALREAPCWVVCTSSSEGTFLDRFSWPVSTPVHHLFYTKSSLQDVVAGSFVPFWGGEGGRDEANNSGLTPPPRCGSFARAPECETASKSPSCALGRVSVTVITWWQHSEPKLVPCWVLATRFIFWQFNGYIVESSIVWN